MNKLAVNICKIIGELSDELDKIESYMPDVTTEDKVKAKVIKEQIDKLLTALVNSSR